MRTAVNNSLARPPLKTRRRFRLVLFFLAVLGVLGIIFAPLLMQRAVATWLRFEAQRGDLQITFSRIHARFLRPIQIEDLRIVRAGIRGTHFELNAPRVDAGLKLRAFLPGQTQQSHLLRSLRVEHANIFLRGRARAAAINVDWNALAAILPDQFELSTDEIIFDQQVARLELHDARISGSKDRSGSLAVGVVQLRAPFLQKNLADLHGVTRWTDDRLTIGSLRLQEGLAIDSLVLDLSRLRNSRIGSEISASLFGGTVRANVATERNEQIRLWDGAATASGISLAQVAAALGVQEPIRGSLHNSKFTFRGDPRDFLRSSASLWLELTGFAWRERQADVIMCGAGLNNRVVQLQQVYVKQRNNELTINGETALGPDWLNPDFHGDIAASINDLGQFAELLGQPAGDFRGRLSVRGRVHAHERRVDGDVVVTGDALQIFRRPVDVLTARVTIDSTKVELAQLELKRRDDFLRGAGQFDFAARRPFQLTLEWNLKNAHEYAQLPLPNFAGALHGKLETDGDAETAKATLTAELGDLVCAVNGHAQEKSFVIDSLMLREHDVSAQFTGTIQFPETEPMRAELSTTDALRFEIAGNPDECLCALELTDAANGEPFTNLSIAAGAVSLRNAATNQEAKTVSVCRDNKETAATLRINVARPTPPPAATPSFLSP